MGRGRGEEKRERERSRLGPGSDSRGCGSANLRALTRGAAPPRSDICPPGARGAERLGRADAALRGRRCTCRGSRPPLRAPSPPAAPASRSVPAAPRPRSPPPGRSRREPSPAPRRRPFSAGPAPAPSAAHGAADRIATSGRHHHPQAAAPRPEWAASLGPRAPDERGPGPRDPSRPLREQGLIRLRPQLRGRGPLGTAAEGAAARERREGAAPRWPGKRARRRWAPSTRCGPGHSPGAGSCPTPDGP